MKRFGSLAAALVRSGAYGDALGAPRGGRKGNAPRARDHRLYDESCTSSASGKE